MPALYKVVLELGSSWSLQFFKRNEDLGQKVDLLNLEEPMDAPRGDKERLDDKINFDFDEK